MTRVASHQPVFLPWIGFVNKLVQAEHFILTVGVPFSRDGCINRVRLENTWLTVPLERHGDAALIKDLRLAAPPTKVITTLQQHLGSRANPYRDRLSAFIERLARAGKGDFLFDLNVELIEHLARGFGAEPALHVDDAPPAAPTKTERLISRVRRFVPGSRISYLAGTGALDYLDRALIPADWTISVQSIATGIEDRTSLAFLTREADPHAAALQSATWKEW